MMDPAAPPAGPPAGPSLEERLRAAQQETARRGAGTRAFISYARRDGDVARRLVAALDEAGIEAWVDWKDIPGTAAWREEIAAGIEAADSVIMLLSPAALASQPCRDEIDHALRYNKRIVPVVCAEVASAACPPEIERLNWLWLRPQDDFAAGMAALLAALRTDLEWVRLHTHLLERAVEWQARGHEASLLLRGANLRAAEAWLGGAQDKDPAPTALHAQYILASRRAETARQRLTVGATSAGMVIALALAVAALLFQQQAMRNQQAAQRQQHIAEQQRALAEQQRALDVARLVTAEANVLRAQSAQSADMLETSTLLALEAERRLPSVDAATTLGLDLRVLPPPLWRVGGDWSEIEQITAPDGVIALAFSADGHELATTTADGATRLWAWRPATWWRRAAPASRATSRARNGRCTWRANHTGAPAPRWRVWAAPDRVGAGARGARPPSTPWDDARAGERPARVRAHAVTFSCPRRSHR